MKNRRGIIELPIIVFLAVNSLCIGYTALTGKGKPQELSADHASKNYCKDLMCGGPQVGGGYPSSENKGNF